MAGAASGLKVLEVSQGMPGSLAGMLLADQGAEVVKLEAPSGDPYASEAGFRLWNRGKVRVSADLRDTDAADAFRKLARAADVVIVGLSQSTAESLGLTYEALSRDNPRLVFATITGYGWGSQRRDEFATDGTIHARMGSMLSPQNGGAREGPIYVAPRIASYAAALTCVQGILGALHVRETSGRGQHVDASLLRGALNYRGNGLLTATQHQEDLPVLPAIREPRGNRPLFNLCECADGRWISMAAFTRTFCLLGLGVMGLSHLLEDPRFATMPNTFANDDDRMALLNILWDKFREKPRQEWIDLMWEAKVPCEPVLSVSEFRDHEQLWANGLAVTVDDPVVGQMVQPGLLGALSETPGEIRPAEAEARPTEALQEVLERWGGPSEVAVPAPTATGGAFRRGPLTGVRVLDFTAFVAGPMCGRLLADLGAEVIKVEPPEGDYFHAPSMRGSFAVLNRGKKGVVLDLKHPRSRDVLHDLVREADVVVYNYRMGVEDRLGLDYESLSAVNPKLILCRITAFGPNGPQAYRPGYETSISALSGNYFEQAGEGNSPATFGAADISSGIAGATNVMMAIRARDRTGLGQHVESAMIGTMTYVTGDGFPDYEGKTPRPTVDKGQHRAAPLYGLYETSDGWLFLAAVHDRHWAALRDALGVPDLRDDASFGTAEGRAANATRLAEMLTGVFGERRTADWEALLESADVPFVNPMVQTPSFFLDDPRSVEDALVVRLPHPHFETLTEPGVPVRLSETPCLPETPEPILGEHTQEVLRSVGISDEAMEELLGEGVIAFARPG